VAVTPGKAAVEYVLSVLQEDETVGLKNANVAYPYAIDGRNMEVLKADPLQ